MLGGTGDDTLNVNFYGYYGTYTDGDSRAATTYVLDGGDDNDRLTVSGYSSTYSGQTTLTLRGGAGNDSLTVTDGSAGDTGNSGQNHGISQASLDGGAGDDTLTASGVLNLSLTGGAGVDSFVLTAQQYRTLLEGTRNFPDSNYNYTSVSADPVLITDFAAGASGDVLDYSDLLRNAALSYDGTNPFGTGFLKLEQFGADTLLSFDADGSAGTASGLVVVARFQNVAVSSLVAANFTPNFELRTGNTPAPVSTSLDFYTQTTTTLGDVALQFSTASENYTWVYSAYTHRVGFTRPESLLELGAYDYTTTSVGLP